MDFNVSLLVETVIKLIIFMPIMGLVGWWLFWAWFSDKEITAEEFGVGAVLWAVAFCIGARSIMLGGWSSFTVLGFVYLGLLTVAVSQYLHWRRVELQHLQSEVTRYQRAIEKDSTAIAAYSLLGQTYLKLRRFDEAEAALQRALEMDPESKDDRRFLEKARRREGGPPKWWHTD